MTTLYDLTGQYLALAELADDPDMPPEALADSLEGLQGDIEAKAQALLQVAAGMDGDTNAIDTEIERLQYRKGVIKNRADRLRAYLLQNMQATGITKISCPLFQITLQNGKTILAIDDESRIPDKFMRIKKEPEKARILVALKAGEDVPGCALGTSKPFLRIT